MKHETLFGFAFEDFEALHVVAGAESCSYQGLGFAAGEDSGAVGARQHPDFDPDGTNFVEGATIGAALIVDNLITEDALAQDFVLVRELALTVLIFFGKLRD